MKKFAFIPSLYLIAVMLLASLSTFAAKPAAKNTKAKTDPAALFQRAVDAYMDYDFDEASDLMEEYREAAAKAKVALNPETELWETRINNAVNAFDRVQNIVVVDSINMPRATFFKAFRMAASAGKVGRPSELKIGTDSDNAEVSFVSEDGDYLLTSIQDESGDMRLVERHKLLDGKWETVEALTGDFEKDGDYVFPFLAGDGQTMYFANNGEESLGGYDLFVVTREPITGESLQPLNLGMPFNSPYDDLMIVIDEEKGMGWWATDRNSPGEDITVYRYILDDVRKNYPSDTENLKEFARLSNYRATWAGKDYSK